jgi:hypothetical protein
MTLRDRIWKEFDKINVSPETKDTIEPNMLFTSAPHNDLMETDLYLFYRMLMTFKDLRKPYPTCPSTPSHIIVYGGDAHIQNIKAFLRHMMLWNQNDDNTLSVTGNFTEPTIDLNDLLKAFGLKPQSTLTMSPEQDMPWKRRGESKEDY